ncbi:MAG: redoxin domain-containing protein [Candidatus Hydrogenedentes bacterium]|nr:redoxin domain-containing protein [Candidatus Hydrogenedentota bacterium]
MKQQKFGLFGLAVAGMALALAFVTPGPVRAAISDAPEIGTAVSDFKLTDYEGKEHSLSAHKGKIVVMSFTSQQCPVSHECEPRYAELAEKYGDKGVVFLSIDSHASTTTAEIAKYATSDNRTGKKLPYPILKDVDNKYADVMGAKRTPEIYIADKDGKLAYHGSIDNQKKPTDADYKNYVAAALDELLAGKPVSEPKHSAYGCGIKRKAA